MKKHIVLFMLILSIITVFAFSACNESENPINTNTGAGSQETTPVPDNGNDNEDSTNTGTEESHAHTYGEWEIVIEPTCAEMGRKQKSCSCGDKETEDIETIEHAYKNEICTICGFKQSSEKLEYTLSGDETYYTVTGIGTCTDADIVIPRFYKGKPVTKIGTMAFQYCYYLKSITISGEIKNIDYSAFEDCSRLTDVYYTNTLEQWCGVSFSDRWSNPMYHAKHFNMLDENKQYYEINQIDIPSGITEIKDYVFCGFDDITRVSIPNTVKNIGSYSFSDCKNLTKITIPDNVTIIGDNALYNCSRLTSAIIGDGVTSIGSNVFYNCTELTNVVIGNEVTSIGYNTFSNCSNLTDITIGDSVTSIDYDAFFNSYSLKNVYYAGDIEGWCNINFSDCWSNPMYYAEKFYMLNGNNEYYEVKEIEIPKGITEIKKYTFFNFNNLTKIEISDDITSIGAMAFFGCESLNYNQYGNAYYLGNKENPFVVVMKATNEYIENCVINENAKAIYEKAFAGCSNLTSVVVPNSIISIGSSAFSSCYSLTIYCEISNRPKTWNEDWNISDCTVVWGYIEE